MGAGGASLDISIQRVLVAITAYKKQARNLDAPIGSVAIQEVCVAMEELLEESFSPAVK